MREIAYLNDARDTREMRTDWYTARVVAMLAAVNNKRERYRPARWMLNSKALLRAQEGREPMTGEQIVARFRQLGMQVIDLRQKRIEG